MESERYEPKSGGDLVAFSFVSDGPKGRIIKLIRYSKTNRKNVYNLGFGDQDAVSGEINDLIVTDNGDAQKILRTIAMTAYAFTDKYPNAAIYAEGSNVARTRLYRMAITNNLKEVKKDFEIYGLKNKKWYEFKKDQKYDAFLIKRKKL